jgi:hypothetical protein
MSRALEGRSVLRVISAMLNDVSLPAIAAVHSGSVPVTERKAQAADLTQAVPPVTPVINPTLRLDAALELVVIEFRNDSGAITTSIPSQRQLREYQRWQATKFGPAPVQGAQVPLDVLPQRAALRQVQLPETKEELASPRRDQAGADSQYAASIAGRSSEESRG